ncbi:MAG: tyrosine-type recombinase/integrase [bacterium]|nr:tyrosine-type recombinase/integrase [bacterium]
MTTPIPPDILLGLGEVYVRGTIRCGYFRCGRRRAEQVCPTCGRVPCSIVLYWKGRTFTYRRDPQGLQFGYPSAQLFLNRIVSDINDERKGLKTFNPEEYSTGRMAARTLEVKAWEWHEVKGSEVESGELSPGTLREYRNYIRNHWIPHLGRLDVRDIQHPELEKFKRDLKGIKAKTRRNIVYGLRTFFGWLRREGVLKEVPIFPAMEVSDAKVMVALDMDDQAVALARIPEDHRDVIEFGMETGLRPGETCALKIHDLDLREGAALIQRTWSGSQMRETTKGKNKRWIPLSDRALAVAKDHARGRVGDQFLFIHPGTNRGYMPAYLRKTWRRHSGTPVTYYEASRHSFCTQIVETGASALEAQALMRHADQRSTGHYYHARPRKLKELVNRRTAKVVRLYDIDTGTEN